MHILWCFIVKGCVKRPARFQTLISFNRSRFLVFGFFNSQSGGGLARRPDEPCRLEFLPVWSICKREGEHWSCNSGRHLQLVQVAHIRPLCCRCVGLLPPHGVPSEAFFVSGNFICSVLFFVFCFLL